MTASCVSGPTARGAGSSPLRATLPDHLRPRPLEIACGLTVGFRPEAPPLPDASGIGARQAFDDAVRAGLLKAPCLVSFSGGRDSSAVLAAATALARREGHPLPIPATFRFPGAPGSKEDDWQEGVVRHLGLEDWERITIVDELDSIGPVAQGVLRRHGPVWPFNAHFHVPLLERAAGGTLLTGVGGDELLGPSQWRGARAMLARRQPTQPRDLLSVGLAMAPWPLGGAVLARRHEIRWPWLHPHVDGAINLQQALRSARTPLRWSAAMGWWWRSRARVVLDATFKVLAADAGAQVVHPFLEPSVIAATAAHFGPAGPLHRSAAMRELFGDVLADDLLARRSKAHFDEAFFARHSRAFAATWDREGVDPTLVDAERLAHVWRGSQPDPRSFSLLQSVWLHQAGAEPQPQEA